MKSRAVIILLFGFLELLCIGAVAYNQPPIRYRRLSVPEGTRGPESIVFDSKHNGPYTGVSDGRIIRWDSKSQKWIDFAVPSINRPKNCDGNQDPLREDVCGRPLGLQFNPADGYLYIADSTYGLLKVGPRGGVATLLVNSAGGVNLTFTNSLVINQDDGMIYFTDSSSIYRRRDNLLVVTTGDNTGRLLRYDPKKNAAQVLMSGLMFPNGLALSTDNSFLIMAETTTGNITKYWLKGAKAGNYEIFARVPRHPDNIMRTSKGEFWIALEQSPTSISEVSNKYSRFQKPDPNSIIRGIKLSEEGKILAVLGADGGNITSLSEIYETYDSLFIGSVQVPYISIYESF